jgi:hypothetical protein
LHHPLHTPDRRIWKFTKSYAHRVLKFHLRPDGGQLRSRGRWQIPNYAGQKNETGNRFRLRFYAPSFGIPAKLACCGIPAGLALSLLLTRLAISMLVGLRPMVPLRLGLAAMLLQTV